MSQRLFALASDFVNNSLSPEYFVEEFIGGWRAERDSGHAALDSPELSERLSSIFCIADLFNPEENRKDYEFDEDRLRIEVAKLTGE